MLHRSEAGVGVADSAVAGGWAAGATGAGAGAGAAWLRPALLATLEQWQWLT